MFEFLKREKEKKKKEKGKKKNKKKKTKVEFKRLSKEIKRQVFTYMRNPNG